ncbi:MAG: hypothetical protein ACYDB4_18440 [Candidatus Dormibacteraceae bacterium]
MLCNQWTNRESDFSIHALAPLFGSGEFLTDGLYSGVLRSCLDAFADYRPRAAAVNVTPRDAGPVAIQAVHDGVEIRDGWDQ